MIETVRFVYGLAPVRMLVACALSAVSSVLTLLFPVLLGEVVDSLPAVRIGSFDETFFFLLAIVLLLIPGRNAIDLARGPVTDGIDVLVEERLLIQPAVAVAGAPTLATIDDPDHSAHLLRIRNRLGEARKGVQQLLIDVVVQGTTLIFGAALLAWAMSWWCGLGLLAMAAADAYIYRRVVLREVGAWRGSAECQKHAFYAYEQGMGGAASEVRIFGLASFLQGRYWDRITAAYAPYWRTRWRLSWLSVLAGTIRVGATLIVIGFAVWSADTGALSLGELTTAIPLALLVGSADVMSIGNVQRSGELIHATKTLTTASEPRVAVSTPTRQPCGQPQHPPKIVFDDVWFAYPGQTRQVLRGLTWELRAGTASALVGTNGVGKSTIVKLIVGGYRPSRGRILVNDLDLATLDDEELAEWRHIVAPITQEFIRLPLSAGDNVEFGTGRLWSGSIDLDDLRYDICDLDAAARRTGLPDVLARLPDGWRTPLDKTFPGGVDLSGGEWQRVALTRALRSVDTGARVLLMDEPAAALDVESEAALVDGYLDLARNVTSLVISHRLSVVRPVPHIFVLAEGRIVESGTHDELISQRGIYRAMFTIQANSYVG